MSKKVFLRFALAFFVLIILIGSMTIVPAFLNHQNGNDDQSKKTVQVFEEGGKTTGSEYLESSTQEFVSETQQVASSEQDILQETIPTATEAFEPQKQIIGDVTVEVTYAKRIETGIEIGVCFTTLDDGEWYPWPGELITNGGNYEPDESGFTTEDHANAKSTGTRCSFIRYRIKDVQTDLLPIQFTMLKLIALPREMPACQNLQQRLDTNLKAQEYGITIKCTGAEQQSEMSVQLVDFNPSYTKEEVQVLLDEIVAGEVNGPWEFIIDQIE
jgi:hypothetical protein